MAESRFYARFGKRLLDLFGSAIAIILLSPLVLVSAVLVKVTSRGPAFFFQDRPGLHGRTFRIIKFRSMLTFEDSYDAEGNELTNDQRVTRIGAILRRTSIDELPQLFNVFLGHMSLVGPRPALQYQVERYDEGQRKRMDVRPGMTGLAQVKGRNSLTWDQKIAMDLAYVRNVSLGLDVKIMAKTFNVVVSGAGLRFEKHDKLSAHNGDLRRHIGEKKDGE
ncbi:sugar transferase [Microbacterium murale]|uniref:Sugar transferase n=1 Tax=Microbacterium murale TaxID=1081040 RepID=A0ABQ1RR97_9MICO|nr:sugar transferase [Microbacterium murale]GGD75418.1 sugar transferase [Microbacterium murale]